MIQKERIEELVREAIAGSNLFLVSVKVSSGNRISVLADRNEGITIDECAALHRHIESGLDRDVEDIELQVSSPGADSPFHVTEQYFKYEGKQIEVTDIEGKRFAGILKNVTAGGFELVCEIKVKGKGREIRDISFNLDQVKTARAILTIK
ncbi:MAG: ribosome assembly cofactor RimP [Bacteroidales bacterium]|nr:ribosome assembly cofactor RimP [Bacteroidales bacterium]